MYLSKYKGTYRLARLLSCSFKYTGTLLFVFPVTDTGALATAMHFSLILLGVASNLLCCPLSTGGRGFFT